MNRCLACGFETLRRYCHFCQHTIELIQAGKCVSCGVQIMRWSKRNEGKCSSCRGRNVRLSAPTRLLLEQAAKARYKAAA